MCIRDRAKAAVEEGIIAGGGSAYIHATKEVEKVVEAMDGDEKTGGRIILKALEAPLFHIAAKMCIRDRNIRLRERK